MSEAFGSDQSGAVGLAQAGADVLIAERGQEYLQELLSKTQTPNVDVPMFQKRAGLPEAECKPLLQLADKLKLRRYGSVTRCIMPFVASPDNTTRRTCITRTSWDHQGRQSQGGVRRCQGHAATAPASAEHRRAAEAPGRIVCLH